jgi:hypothetical protein
MVANQGTNGAKQRATITVDGTFDIETQDWSTYVAGALYIPGKKTLVCSWRLEERFARTLCELEGTYWAHNGGRFDFLWLLGWALKFEIPWRVSLSGSSIASLTIGKAIFRDSARLVPMSLDKASAISGVRKDKCPVDFSEIRRDMSRSRLMQVCEYMVQDCKATYALLDALQTLCWRWDLDLKGTIGASAWATVRRQGVPVAEWGHRNNVTKDYLDARRGYFGGRTQVFRPFSRAGTHADINSAYPAALTKVDLGHGERERLHGHAAQRAFSQGRNGIYRATVNVATDTTMPPLPVRGKGRIGFPVGTFSGWWAGNELSGALLHGGTIETIGEALAWKDSGPLLKSFCEHVWGLRDACGTKTAQGGFLKLYANSLTGKLAAKPRNERICSDPDAPLFCDGALDCRGVLCGIKCCPHQCTGSCGKRTPISPGLPIFSTVTESLSECSQVHWSAYLTAHCRGSLLDFAGSRSDDLVYCDTDSLFYEGERTENIGSALGQFKIEDTYEYFTAEAPKTYLYADQDGVAHGASKGIPNAVRNFHLLKTGVTVDRGVNTFKTALRKPEMFMRKHMTRAIRPDGYHFGDRKLGPDGRTYPPTARQLADDLWALD